MGRPPLANYSFEDITILRKEGVTWTDIGKRYNRAHTGPFGWYRREKKVRQKKLDDLLDAQMLRKSSIKKKILGATSIRGITYGDLEPTLFISDKSHDEWITHYLGRGYEWELDYLTEMREALWNDPRTLILLPRGHGKTQTVMALHIRSILEQRIPILVITAGSGNARRMYREVKRHLRSPKIREDYGDVIASFKTNYGEMVLHEDLITSSPDPVYKIVGRDGEVIGLHPAWIHLEDVIQLEYIAEVSNERVKYWYDEVVEYTATDDTRFTATGTRKGYDDFYNWLMTERNYSLLHKAAVKLVSGRYPVLSDAIHTTTVDDFGNQIKTITSVKRTGTYTTLKCPSHSLDKLLLKYVLNPPGFESQMQNNPRPSLGLYFERDELQVVPHPGPGVFENFYIAIDPAYASSKLADDTAIVVGAIRNKVLYLLDGVATKMKFHEIADWIIHFIELYNPLGTFVEINFAQEWLSHELIRRGLLRVHPVRQSKNKVLRIDSLKQPFRMGQIVMVENNPLYKQFLNQYVSYDRTPSSGSRHDDILDAVETLFSNVAHYISSSQSNSFVEGRKAFRSHRSRRR